MTENIGAGDFVQMRGSTRVGFVLSVESGQATVCWYVRDKHAGLQAETREEKCLASDLRIFVGHPSSIPDSLMLIRNEKFPGESFRTRER
jgi:hypothetical protein